MEFMDIVDKNDKILGQDSSKNIHKKGEWHRGIHILVFVDSKLILHKKSGKLNLSVSEHLKEGEDYEEAALRGLKEELGIKDAILKKIGKFIDARENDNMISVLFSCKYNGKIKSKDEIMFFTLEEIKTMIKEKELFAEWALEYLKNYLGIKSDLEKI